MSGKAEGVELMLMSALALLCGLVGGYLIARKVMTFQMIPHLDRIRQNLIQREVALDRRRDEINRESTRIAEYQMDATFLRRERDRLQLQVDSLTSEPNRKRVHWLASQLAAHLAVYDPSVTGFDLGRDEKRVDAEMGDMP